MTPPVLTYRHTGRDRLTVDLDRFMISRALIVANSGGGKSWAVRSLLEETFGKVQHIVIDPEGEFHTLREKYPYILAAKTGGDTIAHPKYARKLCHRLMELGASAILDLYELNPHDRREYVKLFLEEMTSLPKALWRPCIVVIDEAHQFAPESGREKDVVSTAAVINFISLARKRGFCPVLATQRISKLNKDAAAELNNKLIGRTGLDVDVKRAGDELGFDKEKRQTLSRLEPGTFYVYGPAISPEVTIARTGAVETTHPEPGQVSAAPPPAPAKVKAMLAQFGDLPAEAEQEARTIEDLKRQAAELTRKLRQAEKAQPAAKTIEKPVVDQAAIDRAVRAFAIDAQKKVDGYRREVERVTKRAFAVIEAAHEAIGTMPVSPMIVPTDTPASAFNEKMRAIYTAPAKPSVRPPAPVLRRDTPVADGVSKSEQRVLNAIALANSLGIDQPERLQVAMFAGYTVNGHFNNMVGNLRTNGFVDYPGDGSVVLTDAGQSIATPTAIGSLDELHAIWLGKVSASEGKLLGAVIQAYPSPLPRAELAEMTGYTVNGHFNNMIGRLRLMGAVTYPGDGSVRAADVLFPEGL